MSDTELRAKRASIKGRLTSFRNYLEEFKKLKQVSIAHFNEIKLRLRKVDLLFEEYDKVQTSIEIMEAKVKTDGQSTSEPDFSERENTEKLFFCAISQAQELIAANEPRSSLVGRPDDDDARSSQGGITTKGVRLPTIRLPNFDGCTGKWLEFRDVYTSIVHNNENLSDISKFQYLKASLLGSAASVIESLEISAANYTAAWKLVSERFDNKRQLIHTHLKSLFNVSSLGRESDKSLRFLIDHISKHLRALNSLEENTDNWDTLIIFMFANKLDIATSTKWEEYRNSLAENPTLDNFYEFLRQRADVLEMITVVASSEKNDKQLVPYKRIDKVQKAFVATASDSSPSSSLNVNKSRLCRVCDGDHLIYNCEKLNQMSVDERNTLIRKLKVCINCLRGGHFAHQCKVNPCAICKRKHNTLLHKTITSSPKEVSEKEVVSSPISLSAHIESQVLLSTAIILVKNEKSNQTFEARCLLDCGSQSCFVTQSLVDKLGMQGQLVDTVRVTGINNISFNALKRCAVGIQPRNSSARKNCKQVDAYIIPEITGLLPAEEISVSSIDVPQNVMLADPDFCKPSQIDILLGADIFWDVISSEQIKLGQNKPILQNSIFGWLIVGPVMLNTNNSNTQKCNITHCGFSSEVRHQLSKFWELEEVPATPVLSPEEEACEVHFKQNTQRLADGRFCVTLPLRSSPDVLGDSYRLARKRFDSLEKRFKRQPAVKSQYVDFINEYAELSHLSESEKPEKACFLPHQPVLKEQSESTRCRVVFDASAKTDSGYSLNDILMIGATVQDDIFSILIRFRQHKFIFTGDIEKNYRHVAVVPSQRHLQMILWREEEGDRMKYLALNTLTYGTSSAPFLSTRCLAQLGHESSDPLVKEVVIHDFYIDDLITGSDDEKELISLYQRVNDKLSSAHFNLRKLKCNSKEFLNNVIESNNEKQDNLKISNQSNTLGVEWNPNSDSILMKCSKLGLINNNHVKYTKRAVLSVASSIFDPLGLLSVCVILCKIFLQSLWTQNLNWDDEIPQAPNCIWTRFINSINCLNEIKIPGHAACSNAVTIDIHAFSDASLKAYAGCIYLKSQDELGNFTVRLLCAKTKVAPLKATTIARLELCASLLVSRLCEKVVQALRCNIINRYYWSDSKMVLGWLRIPTNKLCTFVSHRVAEINDKCANAVWRYVPSAQNPSDLASRGVFPDEVNSLSLWWEGPAFLQDKMDQWPDQGDATESNLPELRAHTARVEQPISPIIDMANYSSFLRLRRMFAYVYRFLNSVLRKSKCTSSSLTVAELEQAESKLAYLSQKESFPNYDNNPRAITGSGKLNPFIDDSGLIRVGGRLDNSNYDFDKKHPILLDAKHEFTILLFRYYHFKLMHAPPQLLLSVIRQQYWPLNGRVLARRTYNDCTRCKRIKGEVAQQIMGNLPAQRIKPGYAFEVVGTDFAGPLFVSDRKGRGARCHKAYLCVFIDFKVKAVHLELVSSLSTEDFILALRRFISRRGQPREIFCDNGRNFVGASRELGEFLKAASNSVSDAFVDDKIIFHFSPAYAPNFGGLYEAAVRSAKFHMKRVVGNTHLTFVELTTLFAQIEAILNSRPLYPMSSSPDDLTPLTPGHFLIGRPLVSIPAPDLQDVNPNRLHRYARIEQARQHFWSRWSQEYICELQQRTRWQQRRPDIKPGQMVLIKDEATPPLKWPLGRIQAVHPGTDGACRVADILTTKGTIRRAINRICPFLDDDDQA